MAPINSEITPDQVLQVMAVFADADAHDSLFWRFDDGQISLYANCSDFFAWATADCEQITADDIPALRQALEDLRVAEDSRHPIWFPELWCARKRGRRPQKPIYDPGHGPGEPLTPAVAALFDACCTDEQQAEFDRKDREFWLAVAAKVRADKAPA